MKRLLCILLALMLVFACGCGLARKKYEKTYFTLFDTLTIIGGYFHSGAEFEREAENMYVQLERLHQLYDIYHTYEGINNLKTINDNAGIRPVKVDSEIIDLLAFSREMYALTDGTVNVCMGSVLSIWHRYREEGLANPEQARLPDEAELRAAAEHMDMDKLVIDREAGTVYLADPDMRLDVGAVAKGYAAQLAINASRARGTQSLILSMGGNVCTIGEKPDGEWQVAIQNPLPSGHGYFAAQALTDAAMVTSGSYQRYYTVEGVRYHHIIHPSTLMPAQGIASVSIICADAGMADALSTALFILPPKEGAALLTQTGAHAVWVLDDGTVLDSRAGMAQ